MLQTHILQTGGNFFQNIEKQARKKPKSKQECIFLYEISKLKQNLAVWQASSGVAAFVDVLGPTSSSINFPVKNISWFRQKN